MVHRIFRTTYFLRNCFCIGLILSQASIVYAANLQPAIILFNESHYSQAKPLFEGAIVNAYTRNEALYYLGRIALQEGDIDKARHYLDQSVDLEPNTSDEYYWLAVSYGELARDANIFKQAAYASKVQKYYQLAVDSDPKNIAARRGLFLFYVIAPSVMGGGIDKAEKLLSDIRQLSPVDADIEQLDWYGRKKENEKQLQQATFLLSTYPNSAEALFKAGHTFRNQQKMDSAITAFEFASKLPITIQNRMFVEASIFQFGETCQWVGVRTDDAIASIEKYMAIKAEVKNAERNLLRWTLAKLYYQKGSIEKYNVLRKQLDSAFTQQKWVMDDFARFDKREKNL